MNTETATNLFLDSRRSKRLSRVTIDTYVWALGKMAEMFPEELPENPSDIQRLFIENSDLSASSLLYYMGEIANILVVGRERGYLLQ